MDVVESGAAGRATLREIAEAAGVSRSTVSLVLRDSKLVATSTRPRAGRDGEARLRLQSRRRAAATGVSHTVA